MTTGELEQETDSLITRSRTQLAEFRDWAIRERCEMSDTAERTRVLIEQSYDVLRQLASGERDQKEREADGHRFATKPVELSHYRAQFLNHGGHVFRTEHFDAENDDAAKARAKHEFRSGIGMGYEIWEGDRLVHYLRY